ncbi:MAG: hypothetical protein KJ985_08320 [Proteobacteria bacterium]|nr:hypothetical protein [Pseudomonadota bacterium]
MVTPELLVIPGNHDLVRPENQSDPALLTLLYNRRTCRQFIPLSGVKLIVHSAF